MMYPVLKRDGRYVIASRQNNLEKKGEGDGLVHIGLSLPTMKQKLREEIISEMLEL